MPGAEGTSGSQVSDLTAPAQGDVEARFTVALPARGRSVLGGWATDIFVQNLPRFIFCLSLVTLQDESRDGITWDLEARIDYVAMSQRI